MPELAPKEKYFARLKKFVIKKTAGIKINWQSTQADDLLKESILRINKKEVVRLWLTFTKELRNGLNLLKASI